MYIRKKAIKNKKTRAVYHYAYAVENKWRKKGARQKVKHYLGKVHQFTLTKEIEFFARWNIKEEQKEEFLKTHTARQLIHEIVDWEFGRHAVQGFDVDLEKGALTKEGKPASIEMGEGMLNSYTLKQLLFFAAEGNEQQDGYRLAKAFVEAGVQGPQGVFFLIFF